MGLKGNLSKKTFFNERKYFPISKITCFNQSQQDEKKILMQTLMKIIQEELQQQKKKIHPLKIKASHRAGRLRYTSIDSTMNSFSASLSPMITRGCERQPPHTTAGDTYKILRNIATRLHNIFPFAQYILICFKITRYIAQHFNIAHKRSIILQKPTYCAMILIV